MIQTKDFFSYFDDNQNNIRWQRIIKQYSMAKKKKTKIEKVKVCKSVPKNIVHVNYRSQSACHQMSYL